MRALRLWIRSVTGQLWMFAITFAGAVVLAVVILCLREAFFERYVREVYLPLDAWTEKAARELASRHTDLEDVQALGKELQKRNDRAEDPRRRDQDLERLYGAWMTGELEGPEFTQRFTRLQREWVLNRLRRSLVAGKPEQRSRALAWMETVAKDEKSRQEVRQLAEWAERRARARGEADIQRMAQSVIDRTQ